MSFGLDKIRKEEKALDVERDLMNKALARLGGADKKPEIAVTTNTRRQGRLIFGLDLTSSRQTTLDRAREATSAMFETIRDMGGIAVKLIYFRGMWECRESKWYDDPAPLSRSMFDLSCRAGGTQIARLLHRALEEDKAYSGVVYIGDSCEEHEDELLALARKFGRKSIPLFMFHERPIGGEAEARAVFEKMAELSGGAYVDFKMDSAVVLRELLSCIAAFSAAGRKGVEQVAMPTTAAARQLRSYLALGAGDPKQLK